MCLINDFIISLEKWSVSPNFNCLKSRDHKGDLDLTYETIREEQQY